MIVLAATGVALLATAPFLARFLSRGSPDPVGLTRILQGLAIVLLLGALLVRPFNPTTAAIPPSPNRPAATEQ